MSKDASDAERASAPTTVPELTQALPTKEPIQLLAADGTLAVPELAAGYAMPDAETLLELHRAMVVARRFDTQVTALTRQGRLATYPSALGQEAAEIAAVKVLRDTDWLFPTYRDSIALLTRGVPGASILAFFRGDWHMSFDPYDHCVSPQATPLATQTLHAVGFGTAAVRKGEDTVCLTFVGDGATSEGDTHEALNFAAVWNAPVVFLVQNNQYAISTPTHRQFTSRSLADRAVGYGMPGKMVDGNDAAAMHAVLSEAVERARSGQGPTLIEARTYRIESHTNSDDPTRYREDSEREEWRKKDPIARLEAHLRSTGDLDDERLAKVTEEAEALAAATRDAMNAEPELDPLELFDHVYANERPALREQREYLAAELAARVDAEGGRN
ncbi:3-methyl-2-oxobutanoate dehydrogenase subunit alpha [Pseudoclavibacter triregionum]|nr:3-methyl-2-oxobutanoate dehydrogenase subunit alpha [Pseudoclavibacter triregionum]